MRSYRRLVLRLTAVEEQGLKALLRGGVQSVRVVLRALALLRLSAGQPVAVVAGNLELTPKAVRQIGWRYLSDGLDGALYERSRPGAAPVLSAPSGKGSSPWCAVTRQKARPAGRSVWPHVKLFSASWCPRSGVRQSGFCWKVTT